MHWKVMSRVLVLEAPAALAAVLIWVDPNVSTDWSAFLILLTAMGAAFLAVGLPLAQQAATSAVEAIGPKVSRAILSIAVIGLLTPFLAGLSDAPRHSGLTATLLLVGGALWVSSLILNRKLARPTAAAWFAALFAVGLGMVAVSNAPSLVIRTGLGFGGYGVMIGWAFERWEEYFGEPLEIG